VTFISLDGLDGTGKSTQCRLLADWLRRQGREVVACVDPGGTGLGQEVRAIVLSHRHALALPAEALLFMASRAQLVAEVIRPALEAGRLVLSDRFLLANVVYQGHAGGLDPEMLRQIGRFSTGGLEPDLTLVLDLEPEQALGRHHHRPADRFESRPADYQARVRRGFLSEAARTPERIKVINASGTVESVHEKVCEEVARFLGK
jgi:dTMP kinase